MLKICESKMIHKFYKIVLEKTTRKLKLKIKNIYNPRTNKENYNREHDEKKHPKGHALQRLVTKHTHYTKPTE